MRATLPYAKNGYRTDSTSARTARPISSELPHRTSKASTHKIIAMNDIRRR